MELPKVINIEARQIDVSLMKGWAFPLVDFFVNQSDDLGRVAQQANNAAHGAFTANLTNDQQNELLAYHSERLDEGERKDLAQDTTLTQHQLTLAQHETTLNEHQTELEQHQSALDDHHLQITANTDKNTKQDNHLTSLDEQVSATNQALTTHAQDQSTHGATGHLVGTGNFCSNTVGGVVLVAQEVADLSINLPAAPDAYDKTYCQSQTDAINQIALKINSILAAFKNAKQMQTGVNT